MNGNRSDLVTTLSPGSSSSPVTTTSHPCHSPYDAMMGFTTAILTCTRSTLPLSTRLAFEHKLPLCPHHRSKYIDLHPNFNPPLGPGKLSQKFGYYGSGHPANTNSMCYHDMSLALLPFLNTIHSAQLTSRSKPTFVNNQPANPPHGSLPGAQSSSSTLALCGPLRTTTTSKIDKLTGSLRYDGYCAYLLIVDSASRRTWCFLTESKEPPLAICKAFLLKFGNASGIIRCDQGGELGRSAAFITVMSCDFGYVVEPTGADSPSQNGGAERYNGTLAVKVRTLLYGSGLPAKFWSAALLHSVFLHNRLVHSAINMTPYEAWHGRKPNVKYLKTFGSRVCVKQSGNRRCKLDHNDFTGIFLGYTATTQNIIYLDLTSGIVKSSHHVIFDEAWYLQPSCPPAAQLPMTLAWRLATTSSHPAARPPFHKPTYPPHGHPCAPHRAHPTTRNTCLHLRRHSTLPSTSPYCQTTCHHCRRGAYQSGHTLTYW